MVGKVTRLHGHRKKVDRLTKAERLERAARLWAIYRNFEPVRKRSERKQHYRHPGIAPWPLRCGCLARRVSYLAETWS